MLRREEKCSMASHYSTANIGVSEIMVLSCLYIYIERERERYASSFNFEFG